MRISLITIAVIILSQDISGVERKSILRFHTILREYDYLYFNVGDRDIIMDVEYGATQFDSIVPGAPTIAEVGDYHEKYSMNFTGTMGYLGRRIKSNPVLQLDHSITALMTGEICKETVLSGNELLNVSDTSVSREQNMDVQVNYSCGIRRYALFCFLPRNLFVELSVSLEGGGLYTNRHRMSLYREELRSYNLFDRNRGIEGAITLSPNIGYGKRHPVAPVYKAFEIERKLKKTGALRSGLSKNSLLEISSLVGSMKSFELSHDRPDKYIMKKLERIIRADSTCDSSSLDAFALFKAYETFSEPFPLLFYGFEIKFISTYEMDTYYDDYYSPYDDDLTDASGISLFFQTLTELQLEWTVPLTSRIFPQVRISPSKHFYSKGPYYSEGDLGVYFMVTNRIVAYVSVSEIPVFIIVPYENPGKVEFKVDFYLEDHISLTLYGFKRFREIISTSGYSSFGITNHSFRETEGISLKVNYDF